MTRTEWLRATRHRRRAQSTLATLTGFALMLALLYRWLS